MKSVHLRLILAALALFAASAACMSASGGEPEAASTSAAVSVASFGPTQTAEPTPLATEPPAATSTQPQSSPQAQPTASALVTLPPPVPGPNSLDLVGLSSEPIVPDFQESYIQEMSWTDPDGSLQQADMVYDFSQQTTPLDAWSLLYEDNNPFLASRFETARIGPQGYSLSAETTCQLVDPASLADQQPRDSFDDLFQAFTGTAGLSEAEVELDSQVVDVYTLEPENFLPGAEIVITASAANEEGEFTSSSTSTLRLVEEGTVLESGRLYLARQGGYVRQVELVYSRTADQNDAPFAQPGSRMERSLVYAFKPALEAGAPIAPPEGCPGSGDDSRSAEPTAPSGAETAEAGSLPRMADASNVLDSGNSLTYETASSVTEVVEFYKQELEAQGWALDDEISLGTLATLEFSRDGGSLSLTAIESGDGTMVTIVLG